MFVVTSSLAILLALLQSGAAQPAATPESLVVQFVLRNETMKQHASVVENELTISAGANEPYLSSVKVGDFEATGEIEVPTGAARRCTCTHR